MIGWLAELFRIRSDDRRLKAWREQRTSDEFWAGRRLSDARRGPFGDPCRNRIKKARARLGGLDLA